ncbi:hypothetical protein [Thermococcus aciditolerans]|uniref:Uncharacterized protein n=1 Tax=Thermococcus aciditolerans TaxID=2598455 RepID=A0A5C0SIJ8_9EURY|nr:hypothetical protein [Thermococcus aciditolerans]QEK14263.1 hypothetical protein FPV09_03105 [Thermococcus aciditolerans]
MKMSMKTLLVLFIGALIPLSTAAWAASVNATTTNTTAVSNQTLPVNATNVTNTTPVNITNVTNTTNTSGVQAYNLLVILDKVSDYTAGLMAELNANNVTISNHTLDLYSQAEATRAQAWELYNAGNYSESINASMNALYLYKEVIEELTDYYEEHKEKKMEEEHEYYETIMDAKEELHRAAEYFPYVEKVIAEAKAEGLNVTYVMELYNETKAAYMVVAQDLASGNVTVLKADLEYAEELMDKLEDAVENLSEGIVDAKADEISQAFMEKLQEQMKLMEKLVAMLGNSTINATYLQENLVELQTMYEGFNALVESGQYEEALDMLHDINEELKEIIEDTKEIEKEYKEEKEHEEREEHEKEEREEKEEHKDEKDGEDEYEDDHKEKDEHRDEYTDDESEDDQNGDYEEQDSHDDDNGQHEDSENDSEDREHDGKDEKDESEDDE